MPTIQTIGALVAIALPFIAGLAWLIRLESRINQNKTECDLTIKQNKAEADLKLAAQAQDIGRVETDLKELIKTSIRSDEKMTEALNKLSLTMERVMGRMEHMNGEIIELKKDKDL